MSVSKMVVVNSDHDIAAVDAQEVSHIQYKDKTLNIMMKNGARIELTPVQKTDAISLIEKIAISKDATS